jgi:hypothetical protein
MINVYLRLLDFMDGTPVTSADVAVTLRVTPMLRPGGPIPGVDIPGLLPARIQDDILVERPPSAADGTLLSDGQDDVFVERRTSAADGTPWHARSTSLMRFSKVLSKGRVNGFAA